MLLDNKLASVETRIENLKRLLAKLSESKLRARLSPEKDHVLGDLRELQAGLAERRLSRTTADQLISQIEHKIQKAMMPGLGKAICIALLVWGAVLASAVRLAISSGHGLMIGGLLAVVLGLLAYCLVLGCALLPWRRRLARHALNEVKELRQAVARLFDESRDGTVQTGLR